MISFQSIKRNDDCLEMFPIEYFRFSTSIMVESDNT